MISVKHVMCMYEMLQHRIIVEIDGPTSQQLAIHSMFEMSLYFIFTIFFLE